MLLCSINTKEMLREMLQHCCTLAVNRNYEITLPFQRALGHIGDASTRTDDFRAVIGPATERDFHCAGIGTPGRDGADLARRQDSVAADGDAGVAARRQ